MLLQKALAFLGHYRGDLTGNYGDLSTQAFDRAYAEHLQSPQAPSLSAISSFPVREAVAKAAEGEIGVREQGGNNRGASIDKYETATWLKPGDVEPWCASFVCWCVLQAVLDETLPKDFMRPRTPGAWDFERWALEQPPTAIRLYKPALLTEALRGDILVFNFSHTGICVADEANDQLTTVEGNTNDTGGREGDGVYRKLRDKSQVRSIIRFNF